MDLGDMLPKSVGTVGGNRLIFPVRVKLYGGEWVKSVAR